MERRALGATGIEVSPIGVGGWQLGGPLMLDGRADGHPRIDRRDVAQLLHRAEELGLNLVDTAEQYGDGESERAIGEALRGRRDRWVICSKFGALVGPGGERVRDVSAARVPRSLHGSLRRLQTDYLDLYLYHQPPDPAEAEAVATFLGQAKRDGKVRAVGISTRRIGDCELLRSLGCLDVVMFHSNLLGLDPPFRELITTAGAGGLVRGVFAGGRLTGKYLEQPPLFEPSDIRSGWFDGPQAAAREYLRYACLAELIAAWQRDALQSARPATMVQLALRYVLDQPGTDAIVIGGKRPGDYEQAVVAAELPELAAAEREQVRELVARLAAEAG